LAQRAVSLILLLGSYDNETKALLNNIKEEIAKIFDGKTFAFLLENLELYLTDRFEVLAEIEDNQQITVYLFEGESLLNVLDLPLKIEENPDDIIFNYLKHNFDITTIDKRSVTAKYDLLMSLALEIFVVRHKEETRGGEYVELMHALFNDQSEKLWLFRNNSITVSDMLMEYLDMFRVKLRTYIDFTDLKTSILRIIRYSIENINTSYEASS
jgi:hypothetical protein